MKILQLLPNLASGDAIGNETIAIHGLIREMGYETGIFAEKIISEYEGKIAQRFDRLPAISDDDILIYHASTGSVMNYQLPHMPGRKMMIYHNVTPPEFFEGYSRRWENHAAMGYRGMRFLKDTFEYGVADSSYNRIQLRRMSYHCPIDICPLMLRLSDFDQEPDQNVLRRFRKDGTTDLLFVGRIVPNKKLENVIGAFEKYSKNYNADSRLFLVGSNIGGLERYSAWLKELVKQTGLQDRIIFTGHVSFKELLAYYHLADVYVSMSEHEGFCGPLVEAMYLGKPVVALEAAAVPETIGEAGILLHDQDENRAAKAIDEVFHDESQKKRMALGRERKLQVYSEKKVREMMKNCIQKMVDRTYLRS